MTASAAVERKLREIRLDAIYARANEDSRVSLARFLSWVTIDSRPEPMRWGLCRERWQADGLAPIVPAIEAACGRRSPLPEASPRRFWRTRPKGHFKTGEIAAIMAWALLFSPQQVHAVAAASAKDQARLVRDALERIRGLNDWFGDRIKVNQYDASGPGGDLEILSSDEATAAGQLADVMVCDELTWWKKRDLFDNLLAGMIKRPQSVFVIITNAGILGTWQHQVLESARSDPLWDVRETPVGVRPASWQSEKEVESDRRMMTPGTAARMYDNRWTDQADNPLFPAELVTFCSRPRKSILWPHVFSPPPGPRNLLLGWDVGKIDRASGWLVERSIQNLPPDPDAPERGPRQRRLYDPRWWIATQGEAVADQEARLRRMILTLKHRLVAVRIDQGAIGYQLAETLTREFPGLVEGVTCNDKWQGRASLAVQVAAREGRLTLPGDDEGKPDPTIVQDFGQVEQVGDRRDGTPIVDTLSTAVGHGDRFWGLALAIDGDGVPVRPTVGGVSTA